MIDTSTMTPAQAEVALATYVAGDDVAEVLAQLAAFQGVQLPVDSRLREQLGFCTSATSRLVGLSKPIANPPAPTLAQSKAAKLRAIADAFATQLAVGVAYGGHQVALDDGSRANLTALMVASGTVNTAADWSSQYPDYARGWIALDGTRIPLAAPADAQALARAAGARYAALAQHEQDLAEQVAAATDAAGVAAVDPTQGWAA